MDNSDSKLSILIVDDEASTAQSLKIILEEYGHQVLIAENGEEALEQIPKSSFNLVITDLVMPGMDGFALVKRIKEKFPSLMVFIFSGHDSFSMARKALKLGADDFLLKPLDPDQLNIALEQAILKMDLKNRLENLGKLVERNYGPANIVGTSKSMQEVFRLIDRATQSRANVLIHGESGTGKELVARAIYSKNASQKHNFVSVNCCAISEGLIESELFGHVRGAFSGAISDREGLFEMANNGTIFLDEIGDISLNIQTKLLRVLQEGEVRRVGENKMRNVNVRVIAATNKNLENAVKEGGFREDLFYRLNVIPIFLPSLKERKSDIPLLVSHFLRKYSDISQNKRFSPEALVFLQNYPFPGNIRELENIVQRAMSLAASDTISREELESYIQFEPQSSIASGGNVSLSGLKYEEMKAALDEMERNYLIESLVESQGNVIAAAKTIDISRTAFHNKIAKHKIDLGQIRQSYD